MAPYLLNIDYSPLKINGKNNSLFIQYRMIRTQTVRASQ